MKKKAKSFVALVLSCAMCASIASPVFATGESNTLGVVFSASLDKATITKSDTDQIVKLTLSANKAITLDGLGATVYASDASITAPSISSASQSIVLGDNYEPSSGMISWDSGNSGEIGGVTDIITVTYTIPANTAAGTYTLGVKDMELTTGCGTNVWEDTAYAAATLTITNPTTTTGYTASINTLQNDVVIGDIFTVNVGINHSSASSFNAGEVVLNYDGTKLTFNKEASTLGTATVKAANGVLKLEDYGADKTCGNGVYVLKFDAIASGSANVALASSMFSDKEGAAKADLIEATIPEESKEITIPIKKQSFAVTLPDIFTGETSVTEGESYTFEAEDTANYTYGTVAATMGGSAVTVTDNGDGTYTIANVTGALVISGGRTAKSYAVTFAGNAAADVTGAAETATYGQNYTFTMPSAEGWAYGLDGIKINGTAFTGYSVNNSVYTIPGANIKGAIEITVSKSQTSASVTVEGSGAGAAAGYATTAVMGSPYTLTLTPVAGYTYTVTAKMGGNDTELTNNEDNSYTISEVTGNIVFTVEQTVDTSEVDVINYLTLDGSKLWLVTMPTALAEGCVATYDEQNMFWSEKYNAFCYLVKAETLTAEEAAEKIGIATADKTSIVYDFDINKSGKVDVNDAQLAYNMYNAMYSDFTEDVTMEKFLRADANGDKTVNVADSAAVIADILK